jgi:hypothetical protein
MARGIEEINEFLYAIFDGPVSNVGCGFFADSANRH